MLSNSELTIVLNSLNSLNYLNSLDEIGRVY